MTKPSAALREDRALVERTLAILADVLHGEWEPGELGRRLTEELRELAGARCVVLLDHQFGDGSREIVAASPGPLRESFGPADWERLLGLAREPGETRRWRPGETGEAAEVLARLGFGLSLRVPLTVGTLRVGTLLLLGLPTDEPSPEELRTLETLSKAAALVLRNASLYRRQEEVLRDRTRELSAANEAFRRTQLVMDTANDAVFWVNPDGRFVYVNEAACRLTGYSRAELLTKGVWDIDPAFSRETYPARWLEIRKRRAATFESRTRKKDGGFVPVEVSTHHVEYQGWEHHCTFLRDISERKAREREIERLTRLYAALSQINQAVVRVETRDELFEQACTALVEHGPFPTVWIGWVDPATQSIVPVSSRGDHSDHVTKLRLTADPRPGGRGPTGTAIREGRPFVCNDFFADPRAAAWRDNAARPGFRAAASFPIRLGGRVGGAVTVYSREAGCFGDKETALLEEAAIEISFALDHLEGEARRRKAEEDLRKSERRYRLLADNSTDVIWLMGTDGRFTYMSPSVERMFGLSVEEALARTVEDWLTPDSWTLVAAALREDQAQEAEGGGARPRPPLVLEMWHKDGSTVWTEVATMPIRDGDGRLVGYEGLTRDITERRRAEAELAEMEKQYRHAQKMEAIGTFSGGIAHDFNNILTPIMVHADLALLRLPEGAPGRADLESLLKAAQRAADLAQQMLRISRNDERLPAPLSLPPLVKEAMKLLRASLPSTIEIRERIDPQCPLVLADPSGIHQVLLNLVANARDAMKQEGGVLTVSVGRAEGDPPAGGEPGGRVRIAVSDTGCGISLETAERIFEPYFTTKPAGEGTGLGLAVVHGIVRNLGGEVTVRSEAGRGSTFEVLLPNCPEPREPTSTRAPEPITVAEHQRVLVVDDEPDIVYVVEKLLQSQGHEVRGVTGSKEALELFRADPAAFDLLITDQTMPGMTGLQLVASVHALRPALPVILCTGYSEGLDAAGARAAGAGAFVRKPFTLSSLAAAVAEVTEGNRAAPEDPGRRTAAPTAGPPGRSRPEPD